MRLMGLMGAGVSMRTSVTEVEVATRKSLNDGRPTIGVSGEALLEGPPVWTSPSESARMGGGADRGGDLRSYDDG